MVEQAVSGVVRLVPVLLATAVVGVIAVLLWLQARDRRQIASLLKRLERLESDPPSDNPAGGVRADGPKTPPPEVALARRESETGDVSGDVLRGRTTHIKRLVEGPGGERLGLADQAIVKIHQHLEENVTPHQLASELFVSLRTLQRGLAVVLDCTPRQLILTVKMREARRLLADGQTVGNVAERLGFSNPFHFSRRFKEFYHVAPSAMKPGTHR
ncbi:MAG: helix-turn-helix transcriptional regulator [Acidobacteriota bacterium]